MHDTAVLLPRTNFLKPIPEIFEAQKLLDQAANAHCSGQRELAETLLIEADIPAIARWTESIWGKRNQDIVRVREVDHAPPWLSKDARPKPRMPDRATKKLIVARDGFRCRFCGIPVIDRSIRLKLCAQYPNALRWGRTNSEQHAAFQCMWLQYDHVLPNSRGGESSLENVVVTCAPCNFGRMEFTLEEVGIIDPRLRDVVRSSWDGLERIASSSN